MISKKTIGLFSVLSAAMVNFPFSADAHGGAKGIVKERMDSMETLGKAMKYVSGMVRGDVQFDMNTVDEAAQTIILHGARIPELFPRGSNKGFTEASPKIWTDFQQFKTDADKMVAAARALSKAAKSNDVAVVGHAHKVLGKTCGECHSKFRTKNKIARDEHDSIWSKMAEKISRFFGN